MLSKKELLYTLALQRVPNLGDTSAKKLIQVVGSAEGIFKEKKSRLLKIEGIGQIKLKELSLDLHLPEAEAELSFIEDHKINYSYFLDKHYPEGLKHCLDGPILFSVREISTFKIKNSLALLGHEMLLPTALTFAKNFLKILRL